MMNRAVFAGIAVSVLACLTGCSAGGGGKLQDAGTGFTIDYRFSDLPPGCPPVTGNDKGIGAPCTHGGGQCKSGHICACDTTAGVTPPQGTPCFCTILVLQSCDTIPAGTCGQNAMCCSYMQQAALCVPDACLQSATCPAF
jgi:hypothetical protein